MQDKVVIVTGAFGILGRAVAEAIAAAGGKVVAVDLALTPPPGLEASIGPDSLVLGGVDLTDPAAARRAVDDAVHRLGRLDALINVAGGFAWETLAEGAAATWDRLYALNVKTCANMCRAAAPDLVKTHGRIVNVGAGGAVKAGAGMGAYAASKSGVHRLTEDHRYAAEPRRHAQGRSREMGGARRPGASHPVPGVRQGAGRDRRAAACKRRGLTRQSAAGARAPAPSARRQSQMQGIRARVSQAEMRKKSTVASR